MVYPILAEILGSVTDDTEFHVEHARHDKIEIGWSGLRLLGNDLDGTALLSALAAQGDYASLHPRDNEEDGPPLNKLQKTGLRSSVQFTSASPERYRTPEGLSLVAGKVQLWRDSRSQYGDTIFPIAANLSLNPTRFARHQVDGVGVQNLRVGRPLQLTGRALRTKALGRTSDGEYILDDNDNCIVERRNLRLLTPSRYRAYEAAYLRYVFEFLGEDLRTIADRLPRARLVGQPRFNLKAVETYWERACNDPHEYIRALSERLLAQGSPFRVMFYGPPTSISRRRNSLFVTRPLRKGVVLTVYAKTNARVRFEVRHDFQKNARHIADAHTSTDISQIITWIDETTLHATELLNTERRNLLPAEPRAFELREASAFFAAFATWSGDEGVKDHVMSVIVGLGSYAGVGGAEAVLIDHLVRTGVLVRGARGARSVSDRFLGVVEHLRSVSMLRH